jgi:hypothetical protein
VLNHIVCLTPGRHRREESEIKSQMQKKKIAGNRRIDMSIMTMNTLNEIISIQYCDHTAVNLAGVLRQGKYE